MNRTKPDDNEFNQHGSVDNIKPQIGKEMDTSYKQAETIKGSSILSSMSTGFTKGQENATALQESMRVNALKWAKLKEKQNFQTIANLVPKTIKEKQQKSPAFGHKKQSD